MVEAVTCAALPHLVPGSNPAPAILLEKSFCTIFEYFLGNSNYCKIRLKTLKPNPKRFLDPDSNRWLYELKTRVLPHRPRRRLGRARSEAIIKVRPKIWPYEPHYFAQNMRFIRISALNSNRRNTNFVSNSRSRQDLSNETGPGSNG